MPHDGDYMDTDEIRTLAQSAKFHAQIRDISEQVKWAGEWMDEEDWKRLFLAAAHGQRTVPNPFDPQATFIVVNNRRSRSLLIPVMSDLIEQITAFGNEQSVKWRKE